MRQIDFPFQTGNALPSTIDAIQVIHNHLLDLHLPLPLPCSLLVGKEGQLLAIYKGPVAVQQLLDDVGLAESSTAERRMASVPFNGRWAAEPRSPRLLTLALSLLEAGLVSETVQFVRMHEKTLASDSEFEVLLFNVGQQLTRKGSHKLAAEFYTQAIATNPNMGSAHYNLALTFLQIGDDQQAFRHLQRTIAVEPNSPDAFYYLGHILAKRGESKQAIRFFQRALKIRPQHAKSHYQLAILNALTESLDSAIAHYRSAVRFQPKTYSDRANRQRFIRALRHTLESLTEEADSRSKWQAEIDRLQRESTE